MALVQGAKEGGRVGHVGLGNLLLFMAGAELYRDTHSLVLVDTPQLRWGTSRSYGSNFSQTPYTQTLLRNLPLLPLQCRPALSKATCDMAYGGASHPALSFVGSTATCAEYNTTVKSARASWQSIANGTRFAALGGEATRAAVARVRLTPRPASDFVIVGMCGAWAVPKLQVPSCMLGVHRLIQRLHLPPLTDSERDRFAGIESGTCFCARLRSDVYKSNSIRSEHARNSSAAIFNRIVRFLGADAGRLFVISDMPDTWDGILGMQRTFGVPPATQIVGSDIDQLRIARHCQNLVYTMSTFHMWLSWLLVKPRYLFCGAQFAKCTLRHVNFEDPALGAEWRQHWKSRAPQGMFSANLTRVW